MRRTSLCKCNITRRDLLFSLSLSVNHSRCSRSSLSVSQIWLGSLQTLQSLQASPVWPVLPCHHCLSPRRQRQDDLLLWELPERWSQRPWHQVNVLADPLHFGRRDSVLFHCVDEGFNHWMTGSKTGSERLKIHTVHSNAFSSYISIKTQIMNTLNLTHSVV